MAMELVARHRIDVIHQPTPVSPKQVSLLYDMGVPVVIGPMNGGMTYPLAFREHESAAERSFVQAARLGAHALNRLAPGKLRATTLLVANERTRKALPAGVEGRIVELVENGVDLSLWRPSLRSSAADATVRFAFSGRLIDWKAVDLLLEAFASVVSRIPVATLGIVGDGPERAKLEALARKLGIADRVTFHGWLVQADAARELAASDVLVLPSLYECGGAVVLEAMALGLPVIATAWGGPVDYLDPSCGLVVEPSSRTSFVADLVEKMVELGTQPALRHRMGLAGRAKVAAHFDWERKIDRILEIYAEASLRSREVVSMPRARVSSARATRGARKQAV